MPAHTEEISLEDQWTQAQHEDQTYEEAVATIRRDARGFLSILGLKVLITKYSLDDKERLIFRDRR